MSADRIIVIPAPYVGWIDGRLSLYTSDFGETATISLSVGCEIIARGEGFGAPQIGPSLLEMSVAELAEMFGAFLSHALESSDDGARDSWSILRDGASDWCDALSLMGNES
jgi:hypothetical protein